MELPSDLWLDQPDAHERIDKRLAAGELSADDAARLRVFVDEGYLTFSLDLGPDFCAAFDADVSRLWEERPADLAVSPPGPGGPTAFRDYEGPVRETGYRIPDLHSHSDRALDLYLHAEAFRLVELIYDAPAISFQSLYFEYGSEQALHRDPMFVITDPAAHLLASWIALEDINEECGPLAYVPRSHRVPFFEFEPGSIVRTHAVPPARQKAFAMSLQREMRERSLEVKPFTCKRGDAFIWHAGLVHGGTRIVDVTQTRKSFVTHYCTAANYKSRTAFMRVREGDRWRQTAVKSDRLITREQRLGLDNPIRA